ncbi:MAG TPA: energy transducer TonB [Gammaproteobacteria bacterium]|nr:energy transducer TonB [Gammaproteobacteria bacterium]
MYRHASLSIRLYFTLLVSILMHIVILLGVGFSFDAPLSNPPLTSIDITLVKTQTEAAPDKSTLLAQANNQGSGDNIEDTRFRPAAAIPMAATDPTPPAPPTVQPTTLPPTPPAPIVETLDSDDSSPQIVTQSHADKIVQRDDDNKQAMSKPEQPSTPPLNAHQLMQQAMQDLDAIQAQLEQSEQILAGLKTKRPISANTRQYAAAAYHEAWRKKIERLGTTNYPKALKEKGINGNLILSVDINPDGSVPSDGIVISRSSGYPVLDKAAIKIVRLGAPYAPVPEEILQDHDVITIVKTWQFESGGLMSR